MDDILSITQPILAQIVIALLSALVYQAVKYVHHQAQGKQEQRVWQWADMIVRSIEQSPITKNLMGSTKKVEAANKLAGLFPKIPYDLISDSIESAVAAMNEDKQIRSTLSLPTLAVPAAHITLQE